MKWDNGGSNSYSYRVGLSGAYDLCIAPGSNGSARCDESAFATCAALGDHNYIQQCCQGSCAYGYDNCYFCPASGTGGPQCFNLAASRETACLASSNCAASTSSSPSPAGPDPSSGTRYAVPVGKLLLTRASLSLLLLNRSVSRSLLTFGGAGAGGCVAPQLVAPPHRSLEQPNRRGGRQAPRLSTHAQSRSRDSLPRRSLLPLY